MFETKRLTIRKFEKSDWQDLHEYLSDPEIVKFEPYGTLSEEECRSEAAKRAKSQDFWAVCFRGGRKVIGNIYISERDFFTWELGYVLNQTYQKNGYATEAAWTLVDYVFKKRHAHKVIALCNPLNANSWRLLERLGMRREGHLRQNVYFKFDQFRRPIWMDTFEYGVLASEWR
jgi:RimJ/RimL family protein N-acetyltransferase